MQLSYSEAIKKDISRLSFIKEQEAKAHRRKPRRVGIKPAYGTLYALRNVRMSIREAALRLAQMILTYQKTTTGEVKKYIVAPYEWKYIRTKKGVRKMLYAYDMNDRHIKSFVHRNIRKAAITDRQFRPMWPIMIS